MRGMRFAAAGVILAGMVLCCCPLLAGTYGGGAGTPGDPYQIGTAVHWQELMNTSADWDKQFVLTADIDLSGLIFTQAPIAPDTNTAMWDFQGTPFTGVFDGNAHTVSNLTINASTQDYVGLFGYVGSGSQLRNLGVENVNITGRWYVGGLTGVNSSGTIMGCYAKGNVTGESDVGGLVGQNEGEVPGTSDGGIVTACYASGSVTGKSSTGGLIGASTSGTITACYSTGAVTGPGNSSSSIGGFVGYNSSFVKGCFWNTETSGQMGSAFGKGLTNNQMINMSIFQNADWSMYGWVMSDDQDTPRLNWEISGGIPIPAPEPLPLNGSGTEVDPYEIWTPEDFALLSWHTVILDKYITLKADLDMTGSLLYPIADLGPFSGCFDGNGHTIENVTIHQPNSDYVGLFAFCGRGGQIQNLRLTNFNITGQTFVGGLVAGVGKSGLLTYCSVSGTVNGTFDVVGNLAGYNNGTISSCYASGITHGGTRQIGGLVGRNVTSGILDACFATGSVTGTYSIGGLVGQNEGQVRSCFATGDISGGDNSSGLGGLCGDNDSGTISDCYATGLVKGRYSLGGLVGSQYQATTTNSFWDVQTSGLGTSAGGTGKTTIQMQTLSTFTGAGWDFSDSDGDPAVWQMPANHYPKLVWQTPISVPDVVGLNQAQAIAILQSVGLRVGITQVFNGPVPDGQVIGQSVAPGTEMWTGSTVPITVSVIERLIRNPSMERAFLEGVAEEWTGWSTNPDPYYAGYFFDGGNPHHGLKSQVIQYQGYGQESFGSDGLYQVLSGLEPGKIYQVSVWYCPRSNAGWGEVTCGVGIHTQASTDPEDGGTDWVSDTSYNGWKQVRSYFIAQQSTATLFIGISGWWDNETWECWPDPEMGEFCIPMADSWSLDCHIDNIGVSELIIGSNGDVQAFSPVWADGIHTSEITIQAVDSFGNPIASLPSREFVVECSGSENEIIGPFSPTDSTGRTRAWIASTTAETKTVRVTIMGTEQIATPMIEFTPDGKWIKTGKRTASDGSADDYFGYSVAIDGNTAIVGAYGDGDKGYQSGSAYIFSFDGSQWIEQAKLTASDGAAYDYFGYSVAIDDNTAIIGAYGDDDRKGSAYIFSFDGNQWTERAKLTASDGAANDLFGSSIAIGGTKAIVGAYRDGDKGYESGSAYIFLFDGSQWIEQAKLTASDGAAYDYFGYSAAIEGNTAIVGAYYGNTRKGSAYIFTFDGSQWIEQAKLTASDSAAYDYFGISVAMNGNTAIVGAYGDDDRKGSAYIFLFDGSQWIEQAKLTGSDSAAYDYFGYSVAIDGNTAIVGARYDDDKGDYSGSAYIFSFDGSPWMEQAKLTASDGAAYNDFGRSVALDDHRAIVGNSGSVYFFQEKYLSEDFTQDAQVDLEDFSYLTARWLLTGCQSPSWCEGADLDRDGGVNISDLLLFANEWLTNEL